MTGGLRLHRRGGLQGNPGAAAFCVETGHLQAPGCKQPRIGAIERVLHEPLTDKAVKVAAMAIATRIHHQRLPGPRHNGNGFVAKAAQKTVLNRGFAWLAGVEFHHPAVLIAGQPEGIAEPVEA